jgi:hypothetical protein
LKSSIGLQNLRACAIGVTSKVFAQLTTANLDSTLKLLLRSCFLVHLIWQKKLDLMI